MRVNKRSFWCVFIVFTLCMAYIFAKVGMLALVDTEVESVKVENSLSIPREVITNYEREKLVEVEKIVEVEKEVYTFPFDAVDKGVYTVKSVSLSELPERVYGNQHTNGEIVVYASSSIFAEGTLLWIDGIGIRQVQALSGSNDSIYIVGDGVIDYGNYEMKVFEV